MHIAIIGTGYVGLVTGACFAEFGVFVTCVDKDHEKIKKLKKGIIPFFEPGLEDIVKRNLKENRLKFTTRIDEAINESLVVFIAVGTPPRGDGSANLEYVEEVAKEIAKNMKSYKVIVTKSTVPVGTGLMIKEIIKKNLEKPVEFDIVSNPEFLREGSAVEDFMRPNRVVIGAESEQAIAIMKDLYRPLYLIETPFVITDIATSELIKYATNSFLATKISFINEISALCEAVGANVNTVAKAMGLDGRIGSKFLHAGIGFGGSCLPKDTMALVKIAEEKGVELSIVKAAIEANQRQRERLTAKIINAFDNNMQGKTVGILGLSFKPNTDDIRESPALYIIHTLLNKKALLKVYDPAAMENTKNIFPDIIYCSDPYSVAKNADALVIVTEWNQFRNLDIEKIKNLMNGNLFFDFRNIYDPQKIKQLGFKYFCVGRY
ncbi:MULTISPECIES: UDP-glucose/GDP-mannose dehydrogenase family protein [Thermodesulfovibrio]|uniref:UDP-glucose dehydrogenase family protein n=1 Tax=Thermodesulfovibrio TaxID=28261 RepID=UPI00114310B1|nr:MULTISPECIES: UDP-glucose/GDP-mannose dehydrogenase family protein [Thermodesulfovibrio]MDI6864229.1 UDP-glucose/GDP-mannose dehydrogenase family protein [Thermodesulfovibrio yellowstonii]